MAFTADFFTKLIIAKYHYVKLSCVGFIHSVQKNVGSTTTNSLASLSKVRQSLIQPSFTKLVLPLQLLVKKSITNFMEIRQLIQPLTLCHGQTDGWM
jgi:hypothetical protein